jgi:branched-chain amino acid transport system substrate-binding protein
MLVITVLLVVAAVGAVVISARRKGNKSEVIVAVVSSLTGSLAANGKDTANGAQMAIDEAIHDGLNDRNVRVELFDDQGDPKVAVSVANRICEDKRIVAVVGHLTSGCMSAAAPVYERAHMPVIMPVPTNPTITKQGQRNLFRVPPTDDDQAPFLARYVLSKAPEARVAVVSDLTSYGVGFAQAFRDTFVAGGGTVVAFEGAQKDARDFRTLITKLKGLDPKYVVVAATYDMGAPFVKQMRELALSAIPLSGDGCYGSEFLEQSGTAAEGAVVSFIAPDRGSSAETESFFAKYEKIYGKVVSFAPLGYDAGKVVVAALQKVSVPSRESIIDVVRSPGFAVDGVTGRIEFDDHGDNKNKNLVLYVVRDGKWTVLK